MSWQRHKKVLALTKGFRGRANSCYSVAINRLQKSWLYAYRDRRVKKRDSRSMWIQKINAGTRDEGLSYSTFVSSLNVSGIDLNRKILADLAQTEPFSFKSVVKLVQQQKEQQSTQ